MRTFILIILIVALASCHSQRKNDFFEQSIQNRYNKSKVISFTIDSESIGEDLITARYSVKLSEEGKEKELKDSLQYTVTGDAIYILKE